MNSAIPRLMVLACVISSVRAALADPPVAPGVTNEWSFDEDIGNIAVDSIGGDNASLVNWASGSKQWITGMYGSAVDFSSPNQYAVTSSGILPPREINSVFRLDALRRSRSRSIDNLDTGRS